MIRIQLKMSAMTDTILQRLLIITRAAEIAILKDFKNGDGADEIDQRINDGDVHEVGTARMGSDPRTSVLDPMCRAHDVPNLFVADAASFVSQAEKNPTWTILALSMRTSEFIADEALRLNI